MSCEMNVISRRGVSVETRAPPHTHRAYTHRRSARARGAAARRPIINDKAVTRNPYFFGGLSHVSARAESTSEITQRDETLSPSRRSRAQRQRRAFPPIWAVGATLHTRSRASSVAASTEGPLPSVSAQRSRAVWRAAVFVALAVFVRFVAAFAGGDDIYIRF